MLLARSNCLENINAAREISPFTWFFFCFTINETHNDSKQATTYLISKLLNFIIKFFIKWQAKTSHGFFSLFL